MNRTMRLIGIVGALALFAGCESAGGGAVSPALLDVGAIRIDTVDTETHRSLDGITGGRAEGVAIGAASGTLGWLGACGQAAAGDSSGLGAIVCLLTTPIGTVGGGLYGLAMADGAKTVAPRVEAAEAVLQRFEGGAVGDALETRMGSLAGLRVMRGQAPIPREDLRLEVDQVRLFTEGLSVDSTLVVKLSARVRALDADQHVVRTQVFERASKPRPLEAWVAGEPLRLAVTIDELVDGLANDVAERWFLAADVELVATAPRAGGFFGPRRLETLAPTLAWRMDGSGAHSLGPDLEYAVELVGDDGSRVSATVTDTAWSPGQPLAACTVYSWTVRAQWTRYGEPRSRESGGRGQRFRTAC